MKTKIVSCKEATEMLVSGEAIVALFRPERLHSGKPPFEDADPAIVWFGEEGS